MKLRGEYAVHLHRNGELFSFLPGDDVPDWAVSRIDNPTVWETAPPSAAEPVPDEPRSQAAAQRPPESDVTGDSDSGDEGQGDDGAPPRSGIGASRQAWAEHAAAKGITVEPDWKRDDIIAAVEQSGH